MHIDLFGKTAIVSASTAGIGLAAAKGLAASGGLFPESKSGLSNRAVRFWPRY